MRGKNALEKGLNTRQSLSKALLKKCDSVSAVFQSLSHPIRLKILCQLMERERTVNELTDFCGISQSAMSQFLGRMKAEGLVESRREFKFTYYRIKGDQLFSLLECVREIYC